ncbi:hypothetical protein Mal65_52600 [Crateriforma conspicua]|nr:hypothetical protein Mal65_52600 [Crateriforma conspicua]
MDDRGGSRRTKLKLRSPCPIRCGFAARFLEGLRNLLKKADVASSTKASFAFHFFQFTFEQLGTSRLSILSRLRLSAPAFNFHPDTETVDVDLSADDQFGTNLALFS